MPTPEYQRKRKRERRKKFLMLLGGRCAVCGSQKNLQFDHLDPKKKKFHIARMINAPEDVVQKEVEKCQLLCEDCHRLKTKEKWEYALPESPHGSLWRYKKYKCRCDKCKAAMSRYYHQNKH